ncbi:MAG: hypothetical protein AAB484_02375 [Patescibacteria group bacterium]
MNNPDTKKSNKHRKADDEKIIDSTAQELAELFVLQIDEQQADKRIQIQTNKTPETHT